MAFLKSNLPPKVGEDHVYFPTTLDQVIKPDGSRLSMDDLGGGRGGGAAETSDTAAKLEISRTIALSGAVEGSVQFDGSKNVTIHTTSKLTASDVGAVPTSRTINSKALTDNISLTASDVGARPSTWTPSASDVGAVPTSRKINNKPLTGDVNLSGSDISGVVTSVNGSSGAVTVATVKKWTGTLTENSYGYYNFPSGINQTNFISGNLTTTSLDYASSDGVFHSLGVIYVKSTWMLFRVDNKDRSFGNQTAVIYYL